MIIARFFHELGKQLSTVNPVNHGESKMKNEKLTVYLKNGRDANYEAILVSETGEESTNTLLA
ncbi:hypothetical protein [Epilithonimonas lactis]|uniref:Uncharacterized protein n=1 Tax=Epilithonimonas lactis TaxID=421072 RepID=A0A085BK25_9FLAO|nr:hypothetical protein [Epilithonimonas lactis]KFC22820.1 hypothetical protein IO89_07165 [Epilithonimonas lactis]SEQ87983.1 hypothetical protein SAMN04488097_3353 [Epilithonimonas lactis]